MKKIIITGYIFLAACVGVLAQQDPMFSQYMFNQLALNPAYAGSRNAISSTLFYRNQWTGFEGAPVSTNFSIHSPTQKKSTSVGLNISNDRIGVLNATSFSAIYAYRFRMADGYMSFGLNAGLYNYSYRWEDLRLADPNDQVFAPRESVFLPNVGAGALFQNKKLLLGVSAPHLVNEETVKKGAYQVASPRNHYFAYGSYLLDLTNPDWKLKPSLMFKFVRNAPLQFDLNLSAIYKNKLWLGASYRTFNEISLMAQFQISDRFWAGYAYDIPLAKVNNFSRGSHEIFIGYEFTLDKSKIISPRYF